MHHNCMIAGIQIALTSQTDALLNVQVSALWILMKEPLPFLGSSLNGAAVPDKKHTFITHLLKSKQFEIAVMPPARAGGVGSLDGEVRVRCTAEVHARALERWVMVKRMELASSDQRSKRSECWTSEEFARIARFFVEKVSQYLDDAGEDEGWIIALLNAKKVGESLAPFWPQTPQCPCTGLRELAGGFRISQ